MTLRDQAKVRGRSHSHLVWPLCVSTRTDLLPLCNRFDPAHFLQPFSPCTLRLSHSAHTHTHAHTHTLVLTALQGGEGAANEAKLQDMTAPHFSSLLFSSCTHSPLTGLTGLTDALLCMHYAHTHGHTDIRTHTPLSPPRRWRRCKAKWQPVRPGCGTRLRLPRWPPLRGVRGQRGR